jgi:hypothetical protein
MKYLLFNTQAQAEARCLERLSDPDNCTTKFLWGIRETKAGKWALCIDEPVLPASYTEDIYLNGEVIETITVTNLGGLTPTEISNLKDSVIWPTS